MAIAFNPDLDLEALTRDYAVSRRLQIRDVLTTESAEEIHRQLQTLPWHLAFNQGTKVHELTPEQLSRLNPQQAGQIQEQVYNGARAGYQFLYNHYPLFAEYFRRGGSGMDIFRVFEFLNRPATLEFLRRLTGLEDIRWADAHATLYRAGHFLKFHTDELPQDRRRAAYVLNFTKDWGRDWGGFLQFWDDKFDVELAFRPIFNGLNLFTVPAGHSVSVVAPYSPGLRFSITGWLRADEPPGPIGGG